MVSDQVVAMEGFVDFVNIHNWLGAIGEGARKIALSRIQGPCAPCLEKLLTMVFQRLCHGRDL